MILIMTAVPVERDAVLKGLCGDSRFEVYAGGVGPVASAVSTSKVLATKKYSLVISLGIGGGFPGKAELGSLVVANEIVGADLGVETLEGFKSLDELDFGFTRVKVASELTNQLVTSFRQAKLPANSGPVVTVSTATGTSASMEELARRVAGASAEGMEGFGVAFAAQEYGLPVLEIRAISNLVGPRDRGAWRIKEALDALTAASTVLSEVL